MGLGSAATISLAEARELARECRKLRQQGIDPIEKRRAEQAQRRIDGARAITFEQCAEAYINAPRPGWRDAKHVQQWQNSIAAYADPARRQKSVQAIDTALTCKVVGADLAEQTREGFKGSRPRARRKPHLISGALGAKRT